MHYTKFSYSGDNRFALVFLLTSLRLCRVCLDEIECAVSLLTSTVTSNCLTDLRMTVVDQRRNEPGIRSIEQYIPCIWQRWHSWHCWYAACEWHEDNCCRFAVRLCSAAEHRRRPAVWDVCCVLLSWRDQAYRHTLPVLPWHSMERRPVRAMRARHISQLIHDGPATLQRVSAAHRRKQHRHSRLCCLSAGHDLHRSDDNVSDMSCRLLHRIVRLAAVPGVSCRHIWQRHRLAVSCVQRRVCSWVVVSWRYDICICVLRVQQVPTAQPALAYRWWCLPAHMR